MTLAEQFKLAPNNEQWYPMRIVNTHMESAMEESIFDVIAPKKAVNLSINSDLLSKAKEHRINLSKTLELSLIELLRQEKQREWRKKNRQAVENYNHRVRTHGVFSEGLRKF